MYFTKFDLIILQILNVKIFEYICKKIAKRTIIKRADNKRITDNKRL